MKKQKILLLFTAFLFSVCHPAPGASQKGTWQANMTETRKLMGRKQYAQAIKAGKKAVQTAQVRYGPGSWQVAYSLGLIGKIYSLKGDYKEADIFNRQAISIMESRFGKDHKSLIVFLREMADNFSRQGAYLTAEPIYHRAIGIAIKNFGQDNKVQASIFHTMAINYKRAKNYEEAKNYALKAVNIYKKLPEKNEIYIASIYSFIASVCNIQHRYGDAASYYLKAAKAREKKYGGSDRGVISLMQRAAELFNTQKDYEKALAIYKDVLTRQEKLLGPDHFRNILIRKKIAIIERKKSESMEQKEENRSENVSIADFKQPIKEKLTKDDWDNILEKMTEYMEKGNYRQGLDFSLEAARKAEMAFGKDSQTVAEALTKAAFFTKKEGDYNSAEKLYKKAYEITAKNYGNDSIETSLAIDNMAILYKEKKEFPKAIELYKKSLEIWEKNFGKNHKTVEMRRKRLRKLEASVKKAESSKAASKKNYKKNISKQKRKSPEYDIIAQGVKKLEKLLKSDGKIEKTIDQIKAVFNKFTADQWAWIILGVVGIIYIFKKDWN